MVRYLVSPHVQDDQGVRIEHHNIFDSLRQIKLRRDFKVFSLIALADYFNHSLRHKFDRFLFFFRLTTEEGNIRALQRPVGKADVNIGGVDTGASGIRLRRRGDYNRATNPIHSFLVFIDRMWLPDGQSRHYLQTDP